MIKALQSLTYFFTLSFALIVGFMFEGEAWHLHLNAQHFFPERPLPALSQLIVDNPRFSMHFLLALWLGFVSLPLWGRQAADYWDVGRFACRFALLISIILLYMTFFIWGLLAPWLTHISVAHPSPSTPAEITVIVVFWLGVLGIFFQMVLRQFHKKRRGTEPRPPAQPSSAGASEGR